MSDEKITWDNEVKSYFTQAEIGCMRQHGVNLSLYEAVKQKGKFILGRVSLQPGQPGFMPKGGKRWQQGKIDRFKKWLDAGAPRIERSGNLSGPGSV